MDDNGFIHKKNSCEVVVSKGSINVLSKCYDANFHVEFVVYISAAKYVSPPLLIIPGKRFNKDVIKGCNIEGSNITTAPKGFINSTSLLRFNELFANSVTDLSTQPIVFVYDGCCSHYNDYIKTKQMSLNQYWFYIQITSPI